MRYSIGAYKEFVFFLAIAILLNVVFFARVQAQVDPSDTVKCDGSECAFYCVRNPDDPECANRPRPTPDGPLDPPPERDFGTIVQIDDKIVGVSIPCWKTIPAKFHPAVIDVSKEFADLNDRQYSSNKWKSYWPDCVRLKKTNVIYDRPSAVGLSDTNIEIGVYASEALYLPNSPHFQPSMADTSNLWMLIDSVAQFVSDTVSYLENQMGGDALQDEIHVVLLGELKDHPNFEGEAKLFVPHAPGLTVQKNSELPCIVAVRIDHHFKNAPSNHLYMPVLQNDLAHELFHCFQQKRYYRSDDDVGIMSLQDPTKQRNFHPRLWWLEGSAYLFGYAMSPCTAAIFANTAWDRGETVYGQQGKNAAFFNFYINYVAANFQPTKSKFKIFTELLDKLATPEFDLAPFEINLTASGPTNVLIDNGEIAALSNIDNINEIFAEFAKFVVEGRIQFMDTFGLTSNCVPVVGTFESDPNPPIVQVNESIDQGIITRPFGFAYSSFRFDPNESWSFCFSEAPPDLDLVKGTLFYRWGEALPWIEGEPDDQFFLGLNTPGSADVHFEALLVSTAATFDSALELITFYVDSELPQFCGD